MRLFLENLATFKQNNFLHILIWDRADGKTRRNFAAQSVLRQNKDTKITSVTFFSRIFWRLQWPVRILLLIPNEGLARWVTTQGKNTE